MKSSNPVIVFSACADSDTAQKIAAALVERRLAACVNVVDGARSTYRWRGKVSVEAEALLIIKTLASRLEEVEAVIKEVSGYEVPEVVAAEIAGGSEKYLAWLNSECGR
jgi:periplasmic divalent cation tolerance protein